MFMLEDNIGKVATLCKVSYKFNAIPIEIPGVFVFQKWKSLSYSSYGIAEEPPPKKIVLKKKSKVIELIFPNFKTYYKATVIKTV